jgi:hypothetical protein
MFPSYSEKGIVLKYLEDIGQGVQAFRGKRGKKKQIHPVPLGVLVRKTFTNYS